MGIARVRAGQGWFGRRRHRFCNGNHRGGSTAGGGVEHPTSHPVRTVVNARRKGMHFME
jgi:hypothetical protein